MLNNNSLCICFFSEKNVYLILTIAYLFEISSLFVSSKNDSTSFSALSCNIWFAGNMILYNNDVVNLFLVEETNCSSSNDCYGIVFYGEYTINNLTSVSNIFLFSNLAIFNAVQNAIAVDIGGKWLCVDMILQGFGIF